MRNLNNEKHKNKSFISELYVVFFRISNNYEYITTSFLPPGVVFGEVRHQPPGGPFHDAKVLHFRGDSKVFPHGVTLKNVNLEILVIRYKNTAI